MHTYIHTYIHTGQGSKDNILMQELNSLKEKYNSAVEGGLVLENSMNDMKMKLQEAKKVCMHVCMYVGVNDMKMKLQEAKNVCMYICRYVCMYVGVNNMKMKLQEAKNVCMYIRMYVCM
jgi:hypothetical protein